MADLFKLNAVDKEKVEKGVWFPVQGDCEFLLAGIENNDEYREFGKKLGKKYRRKFRTGDISELAQYHIMAEALAEKIIIDWKNLEWNGKPLKYSKKNALMILKDKLAGQSIIKKIVACASLEDEYLLDFEEDAKN